MSGINRKRDRGLQSQTRKGCQVSAALIVRENLRKAGARGDFSLRASVPHCQGCDISTRRALKRGWPFRSATPRLYE